MNYLSHIFLSKNDNKIAVGNFIGDFVKGSQHNSYPDKIQKGIILHRKIDHFTDTHVLVSEAKAILRPAFGRYSGIILDMYFDYFLALNFKKYSGGKSLKLFAIQFYIATIFNYKYLPDRVKGFIFHFTFTDRLTKYSSFEGLKRSLEIMSVHKVSSIDPAKTIDFLIKNQKELEIIFHEFFSELVDFVAKVKI